MSTPTTPPPTPLLPPPGPPCIRHEHSPPRPSPPTRAQRTLGGGEAATPLPQPPPLPRTAAEVATAAAAGRHPSPPAPPRQRPPPSTPSTRCRPGRRRHRLAPALCGSAHRRLPLQGTPRPAPPVTDLRRWPHHATSSPHSAAPSVSEMTARPSHTAARWELVRIGGAR